MGRVVFTNGIMDLLHVGHLHTLKFAKDLAGVDGKLIVGINSDQSASNIKRTPIINQDDRKTMLEAIRFVDEVIIYNEPTPYETIKELKPDYIVKGPEYMGKRVIGDTIAHVVFPSKEDAPSIHTSEIIKSIKNGNF